MESLGPRFDHEPGRKGVIDVEDWAEIRRLHRAEGLSIKTIVRRVRVSRNTVARSVPTHDVFAARSRTPGIVSVIASSRCEPECRD